MALMLASSQWASAQSRSVKVNVQDSWGPVAGASVLIKGTTTGDVTDLDGNATITNIEECLPSSLSHSSAIPHRK